MGCNRWEDKRAIDEIPKAKERNTKDVESKKQDRIEPVTENVTSAEEVGTARKDTYTPGPSCHYGRR